MNIEFKTELSFDEKILLNSEFEQYTNQLGIKCNYQPFNFVAKEPNEILGFVTGASIFDRVYVNELIVIEKHRGKGIGSRLIRQVEDFHRNKKFKYIELCTTNIFKVCPFYKKLGFEIEYVRENKEDPNLTTYFLIKYLR